MLYLRAWPFLFSDLPHLAFPSSSCDHIPGQNDRAHAHDAQLPASCGKPYTHLGTWKPSSFHVLLQLILRTSLCSDEAHWAFEHNWEFLLCRPNVRKAMTRGLQVVLLPLLRQQPILTPQDFPVEARDLVLSYNARSHGVFLTKP